MLIKLCTYCHIEEQGLSFRKNKLMMCTNSNKAMPYVSLLLLFVLALLPNGISTDDVPCGSTGNYSTIDDAFKHAQSANGTIMIQIQQSSNHTTPGSQFQTKSGIFIIGSGEDSTILNCSNSNQTKVYNFSIQSCGVNISTSRNNCTEPLPFQVALCFNSCKNVTVFGISILHSNGSVRSDSDRALSTLRQTSDSQIVHSEVNTDLSSCPTGQENISGSCRCPRNNNIVFAGYVNCQQHENSSIFAGYCISYSNQYKQVIVAKCPFFSGSQLYEPTLSLPRNVNELDEAFCISRWDRTGKLCKNCINDTGISVSSISYDCVECTDLTRGWLIYIAVTFLPLTLFFIIVVIFQVGVTSPQANGYIFFSQIITIPVQELIIESAWALSVPHDTTKQQILTNLLLFPYSVWSFDFFRIFFARDICLHKSMRIIHVLALQYIPALYPLCLVIISYILIELHGRNCRPVVWLWKPFCFLCVRFRRNWEAKTSIIDAFATFILLSYTKILLVSFSLLAPTDVIIVDGSSVGKILNNDPGVDFFQGDHLPFAILALAILVTIGAIPPLLLLLYPSHTFQRCLSFFKLQSHALQTFVDAFQRCYKNGADGGPERRYFAGIYFVFRIIVFLIFTVVSSIDKRFTILQVTYTVFILVLAVFRPYKRDQYNILDTVFISILAVSSATAAYIYLHLFMYKHFLNELWYFTYALLHIPTLYMAGYVIYWFFIRSKCIQTHCISKLKQRNQVGDDNPDHYTLMGQASHPITVGLHGVSYFPDRLQNPQRYEDSLDSDHVSSNLN